ncbi:MAG: MSMEG_1061 family FMN-dependent PPOX-type flavoprotein [Isosphaeraceae bacterium]
MNTRRFQNLVTNADELAGLIGTPSELVLKKQLDRLDEHMIRFIKESPFLLLGTVDRQGRCDVSPRGDGFGLAKVLDPGTLVIPERKGNRRADSLRNVLETGRVGLLFLIPGIGETLRVNGGACVIRDEEILAPLAADGKTPVVGIAVEVEECYLQCAKAVIRSRLWEPRPDGSVSSVPCLAEMLVDQTRIEGQTVEALARQIEDSYKNNLY